MLPFPMLSVGQGVIAVALCLHRVVFLTEPHSLARVGNHPLLGFFYGLTSDLFLLFFLFGVLELFKRLSRKWFCFWDLVIASAVLIFLGAYLGYYEYFGYTPLPDHFSLLKVPSAWSVSVSYLGRSWRFWCLILIPIVIGTWFALAYPLRRIQPNLGIIYFGVSLFIYGVHFRQLGDERVHDELMLNPVMASFAKVPFLWGRGQPLFSEKEGVRLRNLFQLDRPWADPRGDFPLWQKKIPSTTPRSQDNGSMKFSFQDFIARGQEKRGPWNVVIVLQESLRAQGMNAETFPAMTSLLSKSGISFSETYHVGMGSEFGVSAALCSVGPFNIMNTATRKKVVCLSDIFRDKGYATYYFFGSSGVWSNIQSFFTYHLTDHFIAKEAFPSDVKKGVFGISDHALFSQSLAWLEKAEQPFFAVIQTQSLHAPLTLPEDTPSLISQNNSASLLEKMRRYVDWSWGEFFNELQSSFPQTIVILVADHGMAYDFESHVIPKEPREFLRHTARIPFFIFVPGLPQDLAGSQILSFASNLDVAPTLMSLLQWNEVSQAFLGHDAFSRREPIIVQDYLLPQTGELSLLSRQAKELLQNVVASDHLLPDWDHALREMRVISPTTGASD